MTLANSAPEYVARATVEGLLSLMRFALDAVRNLGAPIDEVILVGGGARSRAVQSLAEGMLGWRARGTLGRVRGSRCCPPGRRGGAPGGVKPKEACTGAGSVLCSPRCHVHTG